MHLVFQLQHAYVTFQYIFLPYVRQMPPAEMLGEVARRGEGVYALIKVELVVSQTHKTNGRPLISVQPTD